VAAYGIWKTRGKKDMADYFLANKSVPWYGVMLSIMATQASGITFLSLPGQAYVDGMRFVQFYFGLPIAMVILSITAVPLFHKLKVFTAYEFLERRFVQRTHLLQMIIVTVGMGAAFFMVLHHLPPDISFSSAVRVAGKLGRLNVVNLAFDWKDRYNIWSGLIGGAFLALSYFGTDQSQVQRYISGRSVAQSRIGLLANGVVKVPMQFIILFIGAMIFVFYQFVTPPLFFNPVKTAKVRASPSGAAYAKLETDYQRLNEEKQGQIRQMLGALEEHRQGEADAAVEKIRRTQDAESAVRGQAVELIKKTDPLAETNDTNYIFLSFVTRFLPAGLVGLILAAILSASMSASAAELSALSSVFVIDIYRRLVKPNASDRHYIAVSKAATVLWGLYAMAFAQFAGHLGSLIEAVNIVGSLFYGTILGIFLIAFYFKRIGGTATFFAAIAAEATVLACYFFTGIPFLWFNVIGCAVLVALAHVLNVVV
jgi:Na+/proline symporter